MDLDVMVTLVTKYDFKDDYGQEVKGCKIYYESKEQVNTDKKKGIEFFIMSAPVGAFEHFNVVPGRYAIHCDVTMGAKGAMKLVYSSANLLDKKVS